MSIFKRNTIGWLTMVLCSCISYSAYAQSYTKTNYTIKDGLPSNEVYSIVQDIDGYIWTATDRGVARFDGKDFNYFGIQQGLKSVVIYEVLASPLGGVVFFGADNLVGRIRNDSVIYDITTDTSLSLGELKASENGFFVPYRNIPRYQFFNWNGDLVLDNTFPEEGYYIVNTPNNTVFSVGNADQENHKIQCGESLNEMQYPSKMRAIDTYFEKINNEVYAVGGHWMYKIDCEGKIDRLTLAGETFSEMFIDSRQKVWIGLRSKGMQCVDLNFPDKEYTELDGYSITSIMEDKDHNLWATSLKNGVFKLQETKYETIHKGNIVKSECDGQQVVWNQDDTVMFVYDFAGQRKMAFPNNYTITDFKIWNKSIFLSTGTASNIEKENRFQCYSFLNGKLAVNKAYIVGLRKGSMYEYKENSRIEFKVDGLQLDYTYQLKSKNDKWYAGRSKGLYEISRSDSGFQQKRLFNTPITSIDFYKNYHALGTKGKGLLISDTSFSNYQTISTKNGLSGNFISSTALKNDTLFVGTDKGVSMIINLLGGDQKIYISNQRNGLLSNAVVSLHIVKEDLIVSTSLGIQRIKIDHFIGSVSSSSPIIEKINGQYPEENILLEFQAGTKTITAFINSIYFNDNSNLLIQYRLIGLDSVWRPASTNRLKFINLEPKNYTLELRSKAQNGEKYTNVSASFVLHPTFRQTIWFTLLLWFLGGITLLGIWWVFASRLEQKNKVLLSEERLKYKALTSQLNPHFIFNAMGSIQNLIVAQKNDTAAEYLASFSALLNRILMNTNATFISLADEIQFINEYVQVEQMRFEKPFEFTWNIDPNLNKGNALVPTMFLQPFIENAIIHGINPKESTGEINVQILLVDKLTLEVIIIDNGIGITASKKLKRNKPRTSMAMKNIKERLGSMEKIFKRPFYQSIEEISTPDGDISGTKVILDIPFKQRIEA